MSDLHSEPGHTFIYNIDIEGVREREGGREGRRVLIL